MDKLIECRKKIDEIDKKMAELFQDRMKVVESVAQYKIDNHIEVLDGDREKEVVDKNLKYISDEKYIQIYKEYIINLMDISKAYQKVIINKDVIGYPGIIGAFSHIAANSLFPYHKMRAYTTFEDVVKAVIKGDVTFGVIPFENSYTGEVGEVSDLLKENEVFINRTFDLKIDQNLLGIKGSHIADIKGVYSHPQAISQSRLFLKGRGYDVIAYPNTAIAARYVSESNDKTKAAIASKETAKIYGLEILAENINTSDTNTTRFIVISKKYSEKGEYFQLLFTVKNRPGELADVINIIASHGFNMENLKSHAISNQPWSYYFHVEIKAELDSKESKDMIEDIRSHCEDMKILGGYDKIIK